MIRNWAGLDVRKEFFRWMFREFSYFDKWIFSQTTWIVYLSFVYCFVKNRFLQQTQIDQ